MSEAFARQSLAVPSQYVKSTWSLCQVLLFDTHGRRLGRGGGFYDRFLSTLRGRTTTIGLVFDQQIAAIVPVDPHDVSVDLVVTDRRMSRRGRLIPC